MDRGTCGHTDDRRTTRAAVLVLAVGLLAGALVALPPRTAEAAVTFADPAFRQCVAGALGRPADRPITPAQAATVTSLHCEYPVVRGLGGVAALTNLRSLDLDAVNEVSDLSPLAGSTRLQELVMPNGRVRDLAPLARLTALTRVDVSANPVVSLAPLASLTRLRTLGVGGYGGGSWRTLDPLRRLPLTDLQVGDGAWTTLEPLASVRSLRRLTVTQEDRAVDVSALGSLTGLRELGLEVPKVADMSPLARLTALEDLRLVSGARHLAVLRPLRRLVTLTVTLPDRDGTVLAGKPALRELDLTAPGLHDLDALAGSPALTRLSVAGSGLRDVRGLRGHRQLDEVLLSGVERADLGPLAGLPRLSYLAVSGSRLDPLRGFGGGFPALRDLQLSDDAITSLRGFRVPPGLFSLDLSSNRLSDLGGLTCDLIVDATGQEVRAGRARPGRPYELGLRSVRGERVELGRRASAWTATGTTITYAAAGTYRVPFTAVGGCSPQVEFDGVVTQVVSSSPQAHTPHDR